MYTLTLDRSTIALWSMMFLPVLFIFIVCLGLPCVAAIKKSPLLVFVAGVILVVSAAFLVHTTLSPYSYYRKKIEPGVALGEQVFRRYHDYEKENGWYPASIGEIYFSELDYFDSSRLARRQGEMRWGRNWLPSLEGGHGKRWRCKVERYG